MNRRVALFALVLLLLSACGLPAQTAPTPDTDAIVQTAIAATAAFQAGVDQAVGATATYQASVDQAVQGTITALPQPPTPTLAPTPDVYEMTEEELAALIDVAVTEAVVASETSSTATTSAASDETLTEEEIYAAMAYIYDAEAAIAYADELITLYYDLYGEYADEAIASMQAIEDDLDAIASSLTEMEDILVQGAEAASAAAEQLNAAAASAAAHAGEAQQEREQLMEQVQTAVRDREEKFTNLAPTEIAGDRDGAIRQVYDYLDAVKAALQDRKISSGELSQIAQLGANAQASLGQHGGPALQGLSGNINNMTKQLARGEWNHASRDVGNFEASLPARPRR